MTTASIRIRNNSRIFSELRTAFPNGCWLYLPESSELDVIYLPVFFSADISEFLEEKMTSHCIRAVESFKEISEVLAGGVVLYAYPFKTTDGSRYSVGTYVDSFSASGNYDLGKTATSAGRVVEYLRDILDEPSSQSSCGPFC